MAKVNLVEKKAQLSRIGIIKFQLMTHCFMINLKLSNNELECLTLLGYNGDRDLAEFCNDSVQNNTFKTAQTVRNFLTKACTLNLVTKTGTNKKTIKLADELQIQTEGNIVLDFKIVHVTKEQ